MSLRTCRKCHMLIIPVGQGQWAVVGTGTTADGLSYCPPDPDHQGKLGDHKPKAQKGKS